MNLIVTFFWPKIDSRSVSLFTQEQYQLYLFNLPIVHDERSYRVSNNWVNAIWFD